MTSRTMTWAVACWFLLAAGCSDDATDNPGKADSGPPAPAKEGAACTADSGCETKHCILSRCVKLCKKNADCAATQNCASDDGKRMFCADQAYNSKVGTSCALTGKCEGKLKCVGGPMSDPKKSQPRATAYCTDKCKTDVDCPSTYSCVKAADGTPYCTLRGFCHPCLTDDNCGPNMVCADYGAAKGKFCGKKCTKGSTECARYAECKDPGSGTPVCMHQAGTCQGTGKLCQPCTDEAHCAKGAMCLTFNSTQESFCAQACPSDSCPTNYKCYGITTASGKNKQCAPYDASPTAQLSCVKNLTTTMNVGDVMGNFTAVGYQDSNKDGSLVGDKQSVIKLYDYAKGAKVILFNVSAGWCTACIAETKTFKALLSTYGPKGVVIFQTLYDGLARQDPPTQYVLDIWVKGTNAQGAVVLDPRRTSLTYFIANSTPLNMLVDAKTFKVLDKWHGHSDAGLRQKLDKYLK